jgi:Protein of unknown function (DUF3105)
MSNREERERLRQQRLASQASQGSSDRRRLILGYVVAAVLAGAVLAGLVFALTSGGGDGGDDIKAGGDCGEESAHVGSLGGGTTKGLQCDTREGTPPPEIQFGDLQESAQKADCELQLDLKDEGASHVPDTEAVEYGTNPPTSGNHNAEQIADGAYSTPLSVDTATSPNVRNFVHSMEHGRVEIQYSPDLPEDQQLALKGVFDDDPGGVLFYPNPDMPYAVAVTSWSNLVGCKAYDPLVLDVVRNFRDTYRGNGPENFPF